jgi:hypothetical protein
VSLKAFHLFFVTVCILLAAFVAAWATGEYRADHGAAYIVTAIGSAAFGAALAFYGVAFQRKVRDL